MALLLQGSTQFGDANLDPLSGGSLTFYDTGTTTLKAVYSDAALTTPLANPYTLDSAGRGVNVYCTDGERYAILIQDSSAATIDSIDPVWGSIDEPGVLYSGGSGSVEAIGAGRFGIGSALDVTGYTALTRTMNGVELNGGAMNTTNRYTAAVKFMSTDGDFTTENPKFLAAICGDAVQTYSGDTHGGMQLAFFATASTPGTTNVPELVATLSTSRFRLEKSLNLGSPTELTISSGAITQDRSFHVVDTEGDASTDDLDTINGGSTGNILVLKTANNARDVVCKDATGNLAMAGSDFTLTHVDDKIMFIYDGTNWCELSRSNNT